MEAKYYTPEIEEFYIGFEFEFKTIKQNDWVKRKITKSDSVLSILLTSDVRVKHLDRQDIEECGWKIKKDFGFEFYEKNGFSLHFYPNEEKNICILMTKFIIKNKSELQKLMKMLNIQTNKR
jgi:hypothetical protein